MGTFVIKSNIGTKTYTVFSKNGFKQVLNIENISPIYSFQYVGKEKHRASYLDAPKGLLESAGLSLSRVIEGNKTFFKVELEEFGAKKVRTIQREEKVFIHSIGAKDSVKDHLFFLADGIKQMFSTTICIDLDNVLKNSQPKLELKSVKFIYKIFSGKGFKANLTFEEVFVKNIETRRSGYVNILNVEQTSSKLNLNDFNAFTALLEKYCKELMPTQETVYQIAKKITKSEPTTLPKIKNQ